MIPVLFALLQSACCGPTISFSCCGPAECSQAKDGFARGAPIIQALETYKKDHGAYPAALSELVPAYLPQAAATDGAGMQYSRTNDGYELSFDYYGPGANNCVYRSQRAKWKCSGFF